MNISLQDVPQLRFYMNVNERFGVRQAAMRFRMIVEMNTLMLESPQ